MVWWSNGFRGLSAKVLWIDEGSFDMYPIDGGCNGGISDTQSSFQDIANGRYLSRHSRRQESRDAVLDEESIHTLKRLG